MRKDFLSGFIRPCMAGGKEGIYHGFLKLLGGKILLYIITGWSDPPPKRLYYITKPNTSFY